MSGKKRILFVCVGNSCRSQMAEAFARCYGGDVLIAASAGVAPALAVAPDTLRAMEEKNLDLRDHFPKGIGQLGRVQFDLIVNMSGVSFPKDAAARIVDWDIADPVSMDYEHHCAVRDQIETMVMKLVLELRRGQVEPELRGAAGFKL